MAKSPIKPRRPVGWNALLRKGHVHERSRSADRSDERRRLEEDLDEYLSDAQADDEANAAPRTGTSTDSAETDRSDSTDDEATDR